MYNAYFGFKESPFAIAPDPRYLYMSEAHREALAHLLYGVTSEGGFVLLTGEVGTGKTTVCRCLLEQLPDDADVALVFNPKVSACELLAAVCEEFRIDYPRETASAKGFVDRINAFLLESHARGRKAVLIIDEAQNLEPEVLEQVRLLTNLETNRRKLLQILMLGQPELRDMLARPELRQLAQRITARYHLGPLKKEEVAAYVAHRLAVAGSRRPLFPARVLNRLYGMSGGVPRLINILCDRALLGTYVREEHQVSLAILNQAAREVFGGSVPRKMHTRRRASWSLAAGLALTAVLGGAALFQGPSFFAEDAASQAHFNPSANGQAASAPPFSDGWTPELIAGATEQMAFSALFRQWGVEAPAAGESACQVAETRGLRCLTDKGSWPVLRRLNRPAILKLYDGQNREFFAALTALKEDLATVVLGEQTLRLPLATLTSRWLGEFVVVWRPPTGLERPVQPGDRGEQVAWLNRQLVRLEGQTGPIPEVTLFDPGLELRVKRFQLASGLTPDGIAGPQTLIHLATVLDGREPLLHARGEVD